MSRRRPSNFEFFVEGLARLPWWLCLLVGAVSYLLFAWLASAPVRPSVRPDASFVLSTFGKTLAQIAQYLIPFACVLAALFSLMRRAKSRQLMQTARSGSPQAAIDGMSWAEFERLIGEMFRERGYRVLETGGGGADGGVDLVLSKGGEKFFVQCKQWRAYKVGVSVVRELYGVMAARGAAGGFVVTSGVFTDEAKAFADGRNVTLLDGAAIAKHLAPGPSTTFAGRERPAAKVPPTRPVSAAVPATPAPSSSAEAPLCPACGTQMLRRKAQGGANAGQHFWGCGRYPQCRGTRPIV